MAMPDEEATQLLDEITVTTSKFLTAALNQLSGPERQSVIVGIESGSPVTFRITMGLEGICAKVGVMMDEQQVEVFELSQTSGRLRLVPVPDSAN